MTIARPTLEGTVAVREGRRLSFAEYGQPRGAAIIWMHGTPGSRRQIPLEARRYADRHGVRSSIVDRMGRHGGTADVRSAPGEGTEVRLHMPRATHTRTGTDQEKR